VFDELKDTTVPYHVMFHVTDSGAPEHVLLPLPTLAASLHDPEAAVVGLPVHPHTPL
jgi:hypothetical protein